MGVLPYYMFNLNDERARRVGLIIQKLVDQDPGMNWKFDDNNMRFLRRKFALRDSLDYQIGFFAAMAYIQNLHLRDKSPIGNIQGTASLLPYALHDTLVSIAAII